MNPKLGVFLRLSYVGGSLLITKYLGSILNTTIIFQAIAFFILAYFTTIIIEKFSSKDLNLFKSWELRFLILSICTLWSPAIGFTFLGICLVFLSFLFLIFTLMGSDDFVEFIEEFFISFLTDGRFLVMIALGLILLIYILINEGWNGFLSLFQQIN